MRILHIGEYVKGGVATYLKEVVEYQIRQNCEVFICLSDYISEIEFPLESKNIFRYPYRRTPKNFLFAIWFIYKTIRKIKPDIVHIHSTFAGVFTRIGLFILPLQYRPKVVYCAHGWSFIMDIPWWKKKIYSIIERMLAYRTDIIINISKNEQEQSIRFSIPQNKCVLVYNGVSEYLNNGNDLSEIQIKNHFIKLLFVGRFDLQKGVDIILDIFRQESFPDIELFLAGGSVLDNETIEIPEGITHLRWLDKQELAKYYKLCDAVIMPSRWEGFSMVALEAMKYKKAIIASKAASLPEVVIDQKTGILFDINNSAELCRILHSLDKKKLMVMGEAGYQVYKEKFTAQIMNEKIMDVYKQLLK